MKTLASPTLQTTGSGPDGTLSSKLDALRRRHVAVLCATGLAMLVVVSLELLAVAMFMDWWIELPWALRLVSLLVQAAVAGWLFFTQTITPLIRQPDEDELALMVERAHPGFRSRLIAAVQLSRTHAAAPNTSTTLVDALVGEAQSMAATTDFPRVVPTARLRMFGAMAVLIPMIALLGFTAGRDTCGVLLRRVFLANLPVPRKTSILVPDGNRVVGIGDTVRLEAFVQGIIPGHGKVEVKFRTRRTQEFPLEQNRDNPINFGRTIENIQESITYQFSLGDGRSESFQITAVARPTVATIECEQQFPAYTALKPAQRTLGDLTLLAGSVLKLKIAATKDIRSASIRLVGLEQESPLAVNPTNARALTGEFAVPVRGLTGFQVQLLDTEAMESRDGAVYRVDVLPDKVPVVRITYPDRKEELLTRNARMIVGFDATDDFQIARLRLRFKVDTLDNGATNTVDLDMEGQQPSRIRRRHEWSIASISSSLTEGSVIEYWLEAEDNNSVTGPGVGTSEHQLARVVSEAEKRADLLNRAGDYLGSISDVAGDQERLNKNLGAIIRAKTGLR